MESSLLVFAAWEQVFAPECGPMNVRVFAQKQIGMTEATERIPNPEPILFQFLPLKFNDRTELERTVKAGEKLALELTGEELTPAGAVTPADRARAAAQGGTAVN